MPSKTRIKRLGKALMSAKEILIDIINNFEPKKFISFFRDKSRNFRPLEQKLSQYNNYDFSEGIILGETKLDENNELLVCAFKANKELSERSGKKAQYILGKKILKEAVRYAGGIFIFYDNNTNFRFSLIYDIPKAGTKRDWSNFKRYTYFVSKDQTNKTFIQQISESEFSSLYKIISAFSVEKVTEEFYREIAAWYFWAMDKIQFPKDFKYNPDKIKDEEIRNSINLIRLITRIIFIWFIKEKGLVPSILFAKDRLHRIVKDFNKSDKSANFYNAILQNLFFGTLNQIMNERDFVKESDYLKNRDEYGVKNLYRYTDKFLIKKDEAIVLFKDIPFLNGGLFDCLDKEDEKGNVIYIDGFSRNSQKQAFIPDYLFFHEQEIEEDLSRYFEQKKPNQKVRRLFEILNSYNFTIDENTLDDQEVALDPELLGKVFENLLASYNPETKTTARKQSGSFYSPREIVSYMVDESLMEYLKQKCNGFYELENRLRDLFSYSENPNPFNEKETKILINAINNCKMLDPACGSGAFPMGMLHKMVHILTKLDPDNSKWKAEQEEKIIGDKIKELEKDKKAIEGLSDSAVKQKARIAVDDRLKEIKEIFESENNFDDYSRKLFLIENCIYGVDIQPIAVQISKLRFFISLVVEQKTNSIKENLGIRPLPNLETKFVAANTLIGLEIHNNDLFTESNPLKELEKELKNNRHLYFNAKTRSDKLRLQKKDKKFRDKIAQKIGELLVKKNEEEINQTKNLINIETEKLSELQKEPEQIEIIDSTDLFGNKKQDKVNKKQEKIKSQKNIIKLLEDDLQKKQNSYNKETIIETANKISSFDIFDQNRHADWFDPEWMFGFTDGFDIVIANPPYIKEYTFRDAFEGVRTSPYYQGKMDLWYLFACKNLDYLKKKTGVLCFIATNNWTTNSGASIMRAKVLNDSTIHLLLDFGSYMIFESADIQTMVILIRNDNSNNNYNFELRRLIGDKIVFDDVLDLIAKKQTGKTEYLVPTISKENLKDKTLTFSNGVFESILNKVKAKVNFQLNENTEVAQGMVLPQDFLNKPNQKILGDKFRVGQGIFVLSDDEKEVLDLNKNEIELIKPYYTTTQIHKWYANSKNVEWIIYTDSKFKYAENIKPYPNIKKHLDKFQRVITSDNKPYGLHRAREEYFFKDEKIIALRKCANEPMFTYTDFDCYVSATFYIIKSKRINLKYLTAILNSKLIEFWLRNKGKMQGNNYQLDKEPLLQIPIFNTKEVRPITSIVDKIISTKEKNAKVDIKDLEKQLDKMVYKLYNLTYEEVEIVDPQIGNFISRADYDKHQIQ